MPEPSTPSAAFSCNDTGPFHHVFPEPSTADVDVPGTTVPEIVGFCLSILNENGPTGVQFPSRSHTLRVAVNAFDDCVPAANDVTSENDASAGFANPTPASVTVQLTD